MSKIGSKRSTRNAPVATYTPDQNPTDPAVRYRVVTTTFATKGGGGDEEVAVPVIIQTIDPDDHATFSEALDAAGEEFRDRLAEIDEEADIEEDYDFDTLTPPDVLKEKYQDTVEAEDWEDYCRTISQYCFYIPEGADYNLGEVEGRKLAVAWLEYAEQRIARLKVSLAEMGIE